MKNKVDEAKNDLLETLKYVKQVLDSENYSANFDSLYDRIKEVIAKYDYQKV